MNIDPAVQYVRRGARIGGLVGGVGGAAVGGTLGALPGVYIDPDTGRQKSRTTGERIGGGIVGAGAGGYLGFSPGRLVGAIHHAKKWMKGYRPVPKRPDWLKGAKTKAEARRAYHAQARKVHPDLHGGNDKPFKDLSIEWKEHEPHFKTAMLNALADELQKIAALGAILGGAAGYKLGPNSSKGKLIGTLAGAGIGHAVQGAGRMAKKNFVDDLHAKEQQELYGYQPVAQVGQGSNFY